MIFSNTTPFISLCAIDRLDLLPTLFGRVHVVAVSPAINAELSGPGFLQNLDFACAAPLPAVLPFRSDSMPSLATARAHSMNSFVTGLTMRFFMVAIPMGGGLMCKSTGTILSESLSDLKRR